MVKEIIIMGFSRLNLSNVDYNIIDVKNGVQKTLDPFKDYIGTKFKGDEIPFDMACQRGIFPGLYLRTEKGEPSFEIQGSEMEKVIDHFQKIAGS